MRAGEVFVLPSFLLAGSLVYILYTFMFLVIYALAYLSKKKKNIRTYK